MGKIPYNILNKITLLLLMPGSSTWEKSSGCLLAAAFLFFMPQNMFFPIRFNLYIGKYTYILLQNDHIPLHGYL